MAGPQRESLLLHAGISLPQSEVSSPSQGSGDSVFAEQEIAERTFQFIATTEILYVWQSPNRSIQDFIEFAISEHLLIDVWRKEIGITHRKLQKLSISHDHPPRRQIAERPPASPRRKYIRFLFAKQY